MSLRPDQVAGIQRLVAASVPGIQADDVTIVDDHGVALSAAGGDAAVAVSQRVTLKQEIERQLARKANDVLEKAFGPGQALASVDVALDMDQVKVSTEDVLTPPVAAGEAPLGVVLREKESSRDTGPAQTLPDGEVAVPATMHRETEYQLGRKVAQTVSTPGAITRLHAVAVLSAPLSDEQIEQVKKLVAGAVGASADRGDSVVVQSITRLVPANAAPVAVDAAPSAARHAERGDPMGLAAISDRSALTAIAASIVIALIGAATLVVRRRRSALVQRIDAARAKPQISRERQLLRIQAWLGESANSSARAES
jgi:flagellar M-ring protein FliF